MSGIMRHIGDDINVSKMMPVTKPLEQRLSLDTQWPEGLIAPNRELELDK